MPLFLSIGPAGFSTQTASLSLNERWKIMLDKGYAGTVLMDLSTALDTINYELENGEGQYNIQFLG